MSSSSCTTQGETLPMLPASGPAAVAFEQLRPRLLQIPTDEVRKPTLEIPWAVSLTLSAIPRVEPLRPALATLGYDCVASLDELEGASLALYYAHLLTMPPPKDDAAKKALLDEAKTLRSTLLEDASALARRGLLDTQRVARIKSGAGNVDTAGDLIALGALLHAAWPHIEGKTAVTREEMERAATLGTTLVLALSQKPDAPSGGPTYQELRSRAFTHLWRHYENCRRGVSFLRHFDGDADEIMPSLFTQRPRRSTRAATTTVEVVEA